MPGGFGVRSPGRTRTCDTRFRKPLLYPLSYGAIAPVCYSLIETKAARPKGLGQAVMPKCAHVHEAPRTGNLPQRLQHVAQTHLNYRRRAALRMLVAFIVSFGLIRLLTFAIHSNLGPFHDIVIGGGPNGSLHIHHYVWGLVLLIVSGFLSLTLEAARWHPILAIPFGIGLALVLDEFALLLQLKDVYWAAAGRTSVDIAILVAALLLLYYLGQCFWIDIVREIRKGFGFVRGADHHGPAPVKD
jgi:hypothetical protein